MYDPAHARSRTVQPMGGNLKPDLTFKTGLVFGTCVLVKIKSVALYNCRTVYDMNVYLGKDRPRGAQHLTATHNTVANLTRGIEGIGHKLYMDNFFPPLTYMTTWPRRKFSAVGQLGYIERACPSTSNQDTEIETW